MSDPSTSPGKPAVFLDRDGTIIREVEYLTDPRRLELLPGAAKAIRRLREAGFACVIVTNQSAVGRGMITEAELDVIHDELKRQLAVAAGAEIDAIESCPDVPIDGDRGLGPLDRRKPGAGMLRSAAEALGLALDASWMVGDTRRDLRASHNAGCRGAILVRTGYGAREAPLATDDGLEFTVVDDLAAAADYILAQLQASP